MQTIGKQPSSHTHFLVALPQLIVQALQSAQPAKKHFGPSLHEKDFCAWSIRTRHDISTTLPQKGRKSN